ncbi:uncharacterized protein GGS22DRAFT_193444 [Annulohypoxylon maeteangense]|uniref:uncharacterized protein n=1 Tax=Annulohypoxylon maeteangense TaxID=1927788 RepID=UPI0020081DFC|nr:uncharacterized protein GGS22DRAFT_193444 [Annulohypoxylon maeteangense]KAI0880236.1 hypothetical protein GGS22DRAFT_193444 [Annulohypoxylon maeteangense]
MSPFFVGESDTEDSYKRFSGVSRRPRAASDSSSIDIANSSKRSHPPAPPLRRSSWGFSQRVSKEKRTTTPPELPKHRLRRTLKWPSLRSQVDSLLTQDPHPLVAEVEEKEKMSSPGGPTATTGGTTLTGPDRDRQATTTAKHSLPMPGLSGNANGPIGNLLKGPVDDSGRLKDAALLVGIKLDLEAEIHATARVRGDIVVGLY